MRVSDNFLRSVEAARKEMQGKPSRSEAIRLLVEQALSSKRNEFSRQRGKQTRPPAVRATAECSTDEALTGAGSLGKRE